MSVGVSSWCSSTKSSDLARLCSLMLQELTVQDPRLASFESSGKLKINTALSLFVFFSSSRSLFMCRTKCCHDGSMWYTDNRQIRLKVDFSVNPCQRSQCQNTHKSGSEKLFDCFYAQSPKNHKKQRHGSGIMTFTLNSEPFGLKPFAKVAINNQFPTQQFPIPHVKQISIYRYLKTQLMRSYFEILHSHFLPVGGKLS